jgi:hypothetical protein
MQVRYVNKAGVILVCLGIPLLLAAYAFPGTGAASLAKAVLYGFAGTILVLLLAILAFLYWRTRRKNEGASATPATAKTSAPWYTSAFINALTHLFTWCALLLLFGGVWWYSNNLLTTLNWALVPLVLCALFIVCDNAQRVCAKAKKPNATVSMLRTVFARLTFFATVATVAYYAHFAPEGTWTELTGRSTQHTQDTQHPGKMVIPEGVPLNPNFTSQQLERNWTATYIATNPQYKVPQMAWSGKKLTLRSEPGREVTDVVNLTAGLEAEASALDIQLSGSCQAILDDRRKEVSKTCVGDWMDRGRNISGKFYLEVKEGGSSRYFDAYLYDGNYLPKKSWVEMMLYGRPISAIKLQFRPKDWSEEKG